MQKSKSETQAQVAKAPREVYYDKTQEQVFESVQSSEKGLSADEASKRLEQNGKNVLAENKKKSILRVFLEQFKDFLVVILMLAAIISGATGEYVGMAVILIVIVLNAILGTVQYVKAEKSLSALKALSAPSCKVLRDGEVTVVPSENVVVGDIIVLEAGDLIVADGRIIHNYSLQVNESSLTGESTAVEKSEDRIDNHTVALGDQLNMLFSGSLVTYGRAIMVVTATGMDTEIGKIATLMNQTEEKQTPLQVSLNKFSKTLAIIIMGICVVVFGLTLWREFPLGDNTVWKAILNSFTFAVALAVAAVPEALGSIVTIVQAMGTQKMAKQNAIIKDLSAVETLGAVNVICSDKTGTLTQNKMTTKQVYVFGSEKAGEEIDRASLAERALIDSMVLVNDSTAQNGEEIGDPTEVALTVLGQKLGVDELKFRGEHERISEIAFDSDRKLMSILCDIDGKRYMLTKGALDVMTARTSHIIDGDIVRPVTEQDIATINDMNIKFSQNGLRVLCFGLREYDSTKTELTYEDEYDLTFVGLVSMIDPPREESREAVAQAKIAGIKTIMITGDHKITASAIAKDIGIMGEGDIAVEGVELDAMSEDELMEKLEHISVYARVSPENKIRIVKAWQSKGNIVSMTGDGVNDAPALKAANIGVAMGITGTEVSKDAASMILTDDNFATIVKSVVNGRNVYANIRNAIMFLLAGNMAGILCVLLATIVPGWTLPFTTIHLLFINLLTDSMPAIAIGMEPATPGLLYEKPRNTKQSILSKAVLLSILLNGILLFGGTMGSYCIATYGGFAPEDIPMLASTMAFATITLARLFHGFNCRGKDSIFKLGIHTNWYSLGAFGIGTLLLVCVTFIPGLNTLFEISPLLVSNPYLVGYIVLFAFLPTFIIQAVRVGVEIYNKVTHKNVISIL